MLEDSPKPPALGRLSGRNGGQFTAQSEYLARIHKTFVDIQGQLLGLPVATVVVATQFRSAQTCGIEAMANAAVLTGAWLFASLLVMSCVNQWFTLKAIAREIDRQKDKLNRDFGEIKAYFADSFRAIDRRILWHRIVLIAIAVVATMGAWFAYRVFATLTAVDPWKCLGF